MSIKITIINASAQGSGSFAFHMFSRIIKEFTNCSFDVFHVGQKIGYITKSPSYLEKLVASLNDSRACIWLSPVYFCSAPAQLLRFIECIEKNGLQKHFKEKKTVLISTSIHLGDTDLEDFFRRQCYLWGMQCMPGFSAGLFDLSHDLMSSFISYFRHFLNTLNVRSKQSDKSSINDIVLVRDTSESLESNLTRRFLNQLPNASIIDVSTIKIGGGCLHCLKCLSNQKCVYDDEVRLVYEKLLSAKAIVFSCSSSQFPVATELKMLIDRGFYLGLRPIFEGKNCCLIIEDSASYYESTRTFFLRYSGITGMHFMGVASTFSQDISPEIMIQDLQWRLDNSYHPPRDFSGEAAHKIYRDFVCQMRLLYSKDHFWFKHNKRYDFPDRIPAFLPRSGAYLFANRFGFFKSSIIRLAKKLFLQKLISTVAVKTKQLSKHAQVK